MAAVERHAVYWVSTALASTQTETRPEAPTPLGARTSSKSSSTTTINRPEHHQNLHHHHDSANANALVEVCIPSTSMAQASRGPGSMSTGATGGSTKSPMVSWKLAATSVQALGQGRYQLSTPLPPPLPLLLTTTRPRGGRSDSCSSVSSVSSITSNSSVSSYASCASSLVYDGKDTDQDDDDDEEDSEDADQCGQLVDLALRSTTITSPTKYRSAILNGHSSWRKKRRTASWDVDLEAPEKPKPRSRTRTLPLPQLQQQPLESILIASVVNNSNNNGGGLGHLRRPSTSSSINATLSSSSSSAGLKWSPDWVPPPVKPGRTLSSSSTASSFSSSTTTTTTASRSRASSRASFSSTASTSTISSSVSPPTRSSSVCESPISPPTTSPFESHDLNRSNSVLLPIGEAELYLEDLLEQMNVFPQARKDFTNYWLPRFSRESHIALRFLPPLEYARQLPLLFSLSPPPTPSSARDELSTTTRTEERDAYTYTYTTRRVFALFRRVRPDEARSWQRHSHSYSQAQAQSPDALQNHGNKLRQAWLDATAAALATGGQDAGDDRRTRARREGGPELLEIGGLDVGVAAFSFF